MKEEEQRRKNLLELVRRRNDGELANRGPISLGNVQERSSNGGVEGEDVGHR
jgi:hypothetical protein